MGTILDMERLVLGTCYYPEHWEENLWEEDLRRMRQTGIEVIRIAEFAWNKIEPAEGNFTFDFYDRFLNLAEREGIRVIFCTPTATPPAWLTNKYPEVLNADINGVLYRHGARRHYNYNSPKYLELCARIVEKSAGHYAKHPAVIGWQIDNELNCELDMFYSESDSKAFRRFLKEKYGTLEELNKAWGTEFWNQTYTDWEEVFVPRHTNNNTNNPHQELDYRRFISDSVCRFAKMQSDIIRKYQKPGDFITTNGIFGHLDYQRFVRESLDFITYDSYPNFAYTLSGYNPDDRDLRDRNWSRNLTETRAISKVFGIMEQQSGAGSWTTWAGAPTPRPGQISLWTMQSVAHGADYISYFRWRTCTFGTEMYWHGILDYSGRDNERLAEVKKVHKIFQKLQEVSGAVYQAQAAILKDYDNVFDAEYDVTHKSVEWVSSDALFKELQKSHTPFDYVYMEDLETVEDPGTMEVLESAGNPEPVDSDCAVQQELRIAHGARLLSAYKVIFYPHPTIMSRVRAKILEKYVEDGGVLIIGCRSGYKDLTGKCVMEKLPGELQNVTGADVFEYTFIAPDAGDVWINWNGRRIKASVFVDRVRAVPEEEKSLEARKGSARVTARYESDYYAGDGALVENRYGKGKCFYYGTAFTEEAVEAFLQESGVIDPYHEVIEVPEDCEIAVRKNERGTYLFVLNYGKEPVKYTLKKTMEDLVNGTDVTGPQILEKYGFAVLKIK